MKFKGVSPNNRFSLADHNTIAGSELSKHQDFRLIDNGMEIPTESYSDQPYIIKTDDGAWLCTVTTGNGHEGTKGQHVISMRSMDNGKTWTDYNKLESSEGPEASYSVLLKIDTRIYCFYNHNTDNIRQVKVNPNRRTVDVCKEFSYPDGYCKRVDSLGYFVFKVSKDHGKTWSRKRYPIDVRAMKIDYENVYSGSIRFFWNVGKPFILNNSVFVPLCKVGGFGEGFFTNNEGVLLKSDNMLSEQNPEKIEWTTLPDGDFGLRPPEGGGPVAGEHSYCTLSDGSIFCVYRTIDGYPAYSISRDSGHTWTPPAYHHYWQGDLIKNPRAANFVWKCKNGKYLYWFHNNGGRFVYEKHLEDDSYPYENRNPVWICGGIETDSPEGKIIKWSQPEILFYDDDPLIRMSYPDLIEDSGKYFISETQKNRARVHEIDANFLEMLWNQFEKNGRITDNIILNIDNSLCDIPSNIDMPKLPIFLDRDLNSLDYRTKNLRASFTLELKIKFNHLKPCLIILDSRDDSGCGIMLRVNKKGNLEILLCDGQTTNIWDADPKVLKEGLIHHIVINVDGGPRIISFIVDGKLLDGGSYRQFGWGRFSPNLKDVNGSKLLRIAQKPECEIFSITIYDCYLLTSEAISSYRYHSFTEN